MRRTTYPQLSPDTPSIESVEAYAAALTGVLGPLVGGARLTAALGFRTQNGFAKAHRRGRLPIPTFEIPGRRGRYAATVDLAAWLWTLRRDSRLPAAAYPAGGDPPST
jgi:hypothetical protein